MLTYADLIKEEIERMLKMHPEDVALNRLLGFTERICELEKLDICTCAGYVEAFEAKDKL